MAAAMTKGKSLLQASDSAVTRENVLSGSREDLKPTKPQNESYLPQFLRQS